MVTHFYHSSLVHHNDLVGMSYSTQSVSYYNNGAMLIEVVEILYYHTLIEGIKRIGGLVEEDIIWILINSPGYQDTLFLSLAQTNSIPTYLSIISKRKSHYIVINTGNPCSHLHPIHVYIAIFHSYVSYNSIREDNTILHYHTTLAAPPLLVYPINISIAD